MRLDDSNIGPYLESIGLGGSGASACVETAGDGNINFVRRVRIDGRSVVVKQARPALERFPEYRVTTERIVFEHRYHEVVAELASAVSGVLPQVLHFDAEGRVLVMEDLGAAPRLDAELLAGRVPLDALRALGRFLAAVHGATAAVARELEPRFQNAEMRALHGEHIFTLPYEPNEFPIAPELRAEAEKQLQRSGVRARIAELRERYYESREVLVHADVQAGNVLLQGDRPRLLDAEIAHVGDPAFDLGTALAHVSVQTAISSDPAPYEEGERALLGAYLESGGAASGGAARGYAGVEILRRTIGAARFPFLGEGSAAAAALSLGLELLMS